MKVVRPRLLGLVALRVPLGLVAAVRFLRQSSGIGLGGCRVSRYE